jgi:hypothetical protein
MGTLLMQVRRLVEVVLEGTTAIGLAAAFGRKRARIWSVGQSFEFFFCCQREAMYQLLMSAS